MPFVTKLGRFSSDIIIPGRTSDPQGFVTEYREVEGVTGPLTIYFSVTGLRLLAQRYSQIGLVPAEVADANFQLALDLKNRVLELEAERDELLAKQERIAGLAQDGFKVQKVMGRPPEKGK